MLTRVFYHNEIHLSPLYTFLLEPSHVTASQAQPYFVTILHYIGYILSQIDSEQKLSALIFESLYLQSSYNYLQCTSIVPIYEEKFQIISRKVFFMLSIDGNEVYLLRAIPIV